MIEPSRPEVTFRDETNTSLVPFEPSLRISLSVPRSPGDLTELSHADRSVVCGYSLILRDVPHPG
jgi:hypothetical protein